MTALCGGGTSGPKAGVAETVIFTTSALASVLNNKGGAWATLVAPLLGVLAYDATELCSTDPPADPGLTAEDYLHLLKLDDFGAVGTALGKLADLAKIAIWYELCECKTVGTPAIPPAALAPPEGIGSPAGVFVTPCWSTVQTVTPGVTASNIVAAQVHNELLPPGSDVAINRNSPHEDHNARVVQSSWTSFRVRLTVDASAPTDKTWTAMLVPFNTLGPNNFPPICSVTVDNNASGTYSSSAVASAPLTAGSLYLSADVIQQPSGTAYPVEVEVEVFCGAGAGGATVAPCGPDPGTLALLQQIYQLLQVVQRQHVPFAYVPGLEYTGLTGSDVIVFTDPVVRVQVDLTTLPGHLGFAEGDPDARFDVGWVALGTADGWEAARAIRHQPFLLNADSDHTRIGYTLAPGVVATIRTFSREV